jgi:UDP-3-O-[3-hydroxymyristoyl] glucosamine N-acyltransferase
MQTFTLTEIAAWVDGKIVGDASLIVDNALPLQDANSHSLTLVDNAKHLTKLENSVAQAAIVPLNFPPSSKTLLQVANPHAAFETVIRRVRSNTATKFTGVHPQAFVHTSAIIGRGTVIEPGACIAENVVIGQNCTIHSGVNIMTGSCIGDDCTLLPGVVLYPGTKLADRVLIHATAVLGAYGFGYRLVEGRHQRTAQLGWVEVESDVEIGAGTTIDCGTFGATRIGMGTKIDNQVQIGHNCHIGRHNLICAHVGIAGSCVTGDYVVMAGQVGVKDHTRLADRVTIGAQAGVMNDLAAGEVVVGSPALPVKQTMQQVAAVARLPDMRKQLRTLQREVERLAKQVNASEGGVSKSDQTSDSAAGAEDASEEHRAA